MHEYRRAADTVYSLHYHFSCLSRSIASRRWRGEVGTEVRDLMRQICRNQDAKILQGHILPGHVHLLLSVPPHLAPSRVIQAIKGKTSHHLLMNNRRLRSEFWGRRLWSPGYIRMQQRDRDRRGDCGVRSVARCRAAGRRPLSSQRIASLHGSATANLKSTSVDRRTLRLQARVIQATRVL